MPYRSPALDLPGACPPPDGSPDGGVAWHYGDPHGEQRRLESGTGAVDLSHRGVVRIDGPDRLSWLHTISSGWVEDLLPGASASALVLSPHGHVEHDLHVVDDGATTWLSVEPGTVADLTAYLDRMRFLLRVEVRDATEERAVVFEPARTPHPTHPTWLTPESYAVASTADPDTARYVPRRPAAFAGREVLVPRSDLVGYLTAAGPVGTWALEALRVAAGVARLGVDTDHRTIPHEVGWVPVAVHLYKGCYRGQETVARVHNLGRPPRRLVLLHLDGSEQRVPDEGAAVLLEGREVGRVGSVARHHELGPVALALVKRSVPVEATLQVDGLAASQEPVVVP